MYSEKITQKQTSFAQITFLTFLPFPFNRTSQLKQIFARTGLIVLEISVP